MSLFGLSSIARAVHSAAAACRAPRPSPDAPGFKPGYVPPGPNRFKLGIDGPDPKLRIGGTHDQREHQRDALLALSVRALVSYSSGHIPGAPRLPGDNDVRDILKGLKPNPPIGTDGIDVTHAVYQSTIPNASPEEAYDHMVNNPGEVFGAGGMEIRPSSQKLEDGGRYMLEIGGPVPTWLPVEIKLDDQAHAITINTLDGHVLRGEQTFYFDADCEGGTVITQDARFQGSTDLVGDMQELVSVADGQHRTWENAHREIYEQFNGDRDFKGIGTDVFNSEQLASWKETLDHVVHDTGTAVDTVLGVGGEVANETFDHWSNWAGDLLNGTGIPGGGIVKEAGDKAGDVISKGADKVGDGAKAVIDFFL